MSDQGSGMTLVEFLEARISEDEEHANAAAHLDERIYGSSLAVAANLVVAVGIAGQNHVRRWEPARALAECEAKRHLIAELAAGRREDIGIGQGTAKHLLGILAAPFADHPDFVASWSKENA